MFMVNLWFQVVHDLVFRKRNCFDDLDCYGLCLSAALATYHCELRC